MIVSAHDTWNWVWASEACALGLGGLRRLPRGAESLTIRQPVISSICPVCPYIKSMTAAAALAVHVGGAGAWWWYFDLFLARNRS